MEKNEMWKRYRDTNYEVSNLGNVRSLGCNYKRWNGYCYVDCIKKPKELKKELFKGYYRVTIYINKKPKHLFIHRMVAQTFIPNSNNLPQVNHKNEVKTDNRVENLEFCTAKYNINYGNRNEKSAIKHRKKVKCVETGIIYNSIREAGKINNIQENDIGKVCLGKNKRAGGYRWIIV